MEPAPAPRLHARANASAPSAPGGAQATWLPAGAASFGAGAGARHRLHRLLLYAAAAFSACTAAALLLASARMLNALSPGGAGGGALSGPESHVVLFTNRQVSSMVVLRSLMAHAAAPERLFLHVVVADAACCPEVLLFATVNKRVGGLFVYTLGELTLELLADGITPAWVSGWAPPPPAHSAPPRYRVRQAGWDSDGKHATPLNHARFYLPHMRFARGRERILFVDDDIVVQGDVADALAHPMADSVAMLVSCNAINFDTCGWFRMAWDQISYAQTSYFGFKAYDINGRSRNDSVCASDAQRECIEPGGMELLEETAASISKAYGGGAVAPPLNLSALKAWNFGYVVMDVRRWQRFQLTEAYEAWIRANAGAHFFAETSLGFGLGLPLLALAGRVQCYDPGRVRIFEGLAVMDRFDMGENNFSLSSVDTAHVLHYTGEHKPWMPDGYAEYRAAFTRFDARLERDDHVHLKPKRLFVLLGGEHAGAEFLMARLDAHPRVCAGGESKGTLHGLRSFARHGLQPPFPEQARSDMATDWVRPCTRQALCTWRHFARAVMRPEHDSYSMRADMEAWRAFYARAGHNATALFERFIRSALRRPLEPEEHSLRLPCFCTAGASHLGFKFFSNWMLPSPLSGEELAARPWAHNYHDDGAGVGAVAGDAPGAELRSARALDVFASLGATFILVERAHPSAAYVSLHKSQASGAWHCERESCLAPNATLKVDVPGCRDYVAWSKQGTAVLEAQLKRLGVAPHVHIVFEECVNDQAACLRRVTDALGVDPVPAAGQPPRRSVETLRKLIPGYDDFVKRCSAADG
jgi:hypothetical protein